MSENGKINAIVATDCESGPREILRGGRLGELVDVGDVEALTAGILDALERRSIGNTPNLQQDTVGREIH